MSTVRKFHPEVRLKKLLAEEGGINVAQALDRADERLESIRDQTLSALDQKLQRLADLANSSAAGRISEIYNCANAVFAEAGVFQLVELSQAAHSLCTLTAEEGAPIPAAALNVHIAAMRALRTPAAVGDVDMRRALLTELRTLAAHVTKPKEGRSGASDA